jgi:hypothetical protein
MSKKNNTAEVIETTVVDHDSVIAAMQTTSAKIRYLLSAGMKRGEVAKKLNIRYQHVRNVELQPLKKAQ